MAERSFAKRAWYFVLRDLLRLAGAVLFRVRYRGKHWLPKQGGALILSNHQSHLDSILVGMASDRQLNYLARETLFEFAPFRWLINSLDAIPLNREGLGIGGLKETLRRLKRGEMVLIFPEGTRTADGSIRPFKPGFTALARRGRVPLVPLGIAGAFEAWPRTRRFPRPGRIAVQIGQPISPEEVSGFSDEQLLAEVHRRIAACHLLARHLRGDA
jgi:1-acyl-sn-glycerol-3-phosphate acyltransferase